MKRTRRRCAGFSKADDFTCDVEESEEIHDSDVPIPHSIDAIIRLRRSSSYLLLRTAWRCGPVGLGRLPGDSSWRDDISEAGSSQWIRPVDRGNHDVGMGDGSGSDDVADAKRTKLDDKLFYLNYRALTILVYLPLVVAHRHFNTFNSVLR
jgi:hypothetical protein